MNTGYAGYIITGNGLWTSTADERELLAQYDHDPDSVSFAPDVDELEADLLRRYPNLEPQYGRVEHSYNGVQLLSEPMFQPKNEEDIALLIQYAQQYGKVRWHGYLHLYQLRRELLSQGVIVDKNNNLATYDPPAAAKELKQITQEALRAARASARYLARPAAASQVSIPALFITNQELWKLLPEDGPLAIVREDQLARWERRRSRSSTFPNRADAVHAFLACHTVVCALIGARKVHRSAPMRGLRRAWQQRRDKNLVSWREHGEGFLRLMGEPARQAVEVLLEL